LTERQGVAAVESHDAVLGRTKGVSAVVYVLLATATLACLDAAAKVLGQAYPATELAWVRYAVNVAFAVVVYGPVMGRRLFHTNAPRTQLVRSCALLVTTTLFFAALRFLPLAETTALVFTAPLITVAVASRLLGERVAFANRIAVVTGFVGVLMVVQPSSSNFDAAIVLPLIAAVSSSAYALLTRRLGGIDHAATTWLYSGMVGALVLPLTAPWGWVVPATAVELVLFFSLGILGGAGHLFLIKAYQRAPAATIAPLGYLELVWAAVLGSLMFSETPDLLSILGIVTIALSGIAVSTRRASPELPLEA
jgi:drug/metabolite transporter (DMT)-like permease